MANHYKNAINAEQHSFLSQKTGKHNSNYILV